MKYILLSLFLLRIVKCNSAAIEGATSTTENVAETIITTQQPIKVIWYTDEGAIRMNENYIETISNQEKAALAYIAITFDRSCNWEEANEENLSCKILSTLDLGYKCSEKHLNFLRKWIEDDDRIIEGINSCTTEPNSNTRQVILRELHLLKEDNKLKYLIEVSSINTNKPSYSRNWSIEEIFEIGNQKLKYIGTKVNHGMNK